VKKVSYHEKNQTENERKRRYLGRWNLLVGVEDAITIGVEFLPKSAHAFDKHLI